MGCILSSLMVKDGSSGMEWSPSSKVTQCCLPAPRKKIFFESTALECTERMPDLPSSSEPAFSIFQFCFSQFFPSSLLRYTKFFVDRTKTVVFSLPTHWISATGLSILVSVTVTLGAALPVVASGGAGPAAQSERRTESASAVHISDVSVV